MITFTDALNYAFKKSMVNTIERGEIYILALSQILPYLAQRSGQENCIVRNKLTTTMGDEYFHFTTNETKIA